MSIWTRANQGRSCSPFCHRRLPPWASFTSSVASHLGPLQRFPIITLSSQGGNSPWLQGYSCGETPAWLPHMRQAGGQRWIRTTCRGRPKTSNWGTHGSLMISLLVAKLPSKLSKRKEGWDLFGGTKGEHGSQEARTREGQHDFLGFLARINKQGELIYPGAVHTPLERHGGCRPWCQEKTSV